MASRKVQIWVEGHEFNLGHVKSKQLNAQELFVEKWLSEVSLFPCFLVALVVKGNVRCLPTQLPRIE